MPDGFRDNRSRNVRSCRIRPARKAHFVNPMSNPATTLISEDYCRMQQELHKSPDYGVASVQFAPPLVLYSKTPPS